MLLCIIAWHYGSYFPWKKLNSENCPLLPFWAGYALAYC